MKRFLSSLLILSVVVNLYAQTVSQIKNDPEYLWGEGEGETLQLADDVALNDLTSLIATHVSGVKRTVVSNLQAGKEVSSLVQYEQIMKTYSSATLTNTQRFVLSEESPVRVFRYIKKSELDKIFASRIAKIREMVEIATEALGRNQIDDAIRYYYWANMLLNSLRPSDDVKLYDGGKDVSAAFLIERRMNEIFDNLKVKLVGKQEKGNIYEVFFTYKDRPVASIDYTYDVGNDWSCVNTARDGRGLVELRPGYNPDYLRIHYECLHLADSQCDKEVYQVLRTVKQINYANAMVRVPVVDKVLPSAINFTAQKQTQTDAESVNTSTVVNSSLTVQLMENHKKIVAEIVKAIARKDYASVQNLFTPQGYGIFNNLIAYGKAQVIGNDFDLVFTESNGYYSCRSVPMRFTFSGNRSFVENVVFVFDYSGKVDNISFGLSEIAAGDIFASKKWNQEAKEVLVSFLENYKTAYALKRADYLESIFAEDALIITGNVVEKLTGSPELGYKNNRYVKLTQHTKSEYMKRLRNTFRYNEFINIKFANNIVQQMGKSEDVYAIQIKQDYFSANYGDTGYLFLLVDVKNPQQPIIHVRAWQENPDPDWGVLGPEHF